MITETTDKTTNTADVIKALEKILDDNPAYAMYLIVDTAQDESIYPMLTSSGVKMECLFKKGVHYPGEAMTEMLKAAAPYLIDVDIHTPLLKGLIEQGWTKSWFTIVFSVQEIITVKDHCAENLMARTEKNGILQFRYFDPRILRAYLPSCTPEEFSIFFGPVAAFCCEDETTAQPVIFTVSDNDLIANYPSGTPWLPPSDPFEDLDEGNEDDSLFDIEEINEFTEGDLETK